MIGNGGNLACVPSRTDDQVIGNTAAACKIDGDDIFRLHAHPESFRAASRKISGTPCGSFFAAVGFFAIGLAFETGFWGCARFGAGFLFEAAFRAGFFFVLTGFSVFCVHLPLLPILSCVKTNSGCRCFGRMQRLPKTHPCRRRWHFIQGFRPPRRQPCMLEALRRLARPAARSISGAAENGNRNMIKNIQSFVP